MDLTHFPYWIGAWSLLAAATCGALYFRTAPYGRHARGGWGPTLHRTAGWVIMESPAVGLMLYFYFSSPRRGQPAALVFLSLWLFHYLYRDLLYPFLLHGGERRMPLSVVAMAFVFNLVNGSFQGLDLFFFGPDRPIQWLTGLPFLGGLFLFLGGFSLHVVSDAQLRRLRRPGEEGYNIPRGGAFRWVSCPNYLGELVQWLGWALLTASLAGGSFFLWSAANLVPRAWAHHRWYQRQFPDYPPQRRALVPFFY